MPPKAFKRPTRASNAQKHHPMNTDLKTVDEVAACIRKILHSNDVKEGTKRARTIECAFIQGMMTADPRYVNNAYLALCLISGRSIL